MRVWKPLRDANTLKTHSVKLIMTISVFSFSMLVSIPILGCGLATTEFESDHEVKIQQNQVVHSSSTNGDTTTSGLSLGMQNKISDIDSVQDSFSAKSNRIISDGTPSVQTTINTKSGKSSNVIDGEGNSKISPVEVAQIGHMVGDLAPSFAIKFTDGKQLSIDNHKIHSKPIFLFFFAKW